MPDDQDTILTDLQTTCESLGLSPEGDVKALRQRIRDAGSGRTERPSRASRAPRPPGPRQAGGTPSPDDEPEAEKPRRKSPQEKRLREALAGTYASVGMMAQAVGTGQMMARGLQEPPPALRIGMVLMDSDTIDGCVDAWLDLADQNPRVRKALIKAMEGTAIAGLIGVHVAIALKAGLLPGFQPLTNAAHNGGLAG